MTISDRSKNAVLDTTASPKPLAILADEESRSRAALLKQLEARGYEVFPGDSLRITDEIEPEDYNRVSLLVISGALVSDELDVLFPMVPRIEIGADEAASSGGRRGLQPIVSLARPVDAGALDAALNLCCDYSTFFQEAVRRHVFAAQPSSIEEPIARIIHDLNNQITGLKGGIDLLNYSINLMQDRESQQKFSRYMDQFIQPSLAQIEFLIRTWRRLREAHVRPTHPVDLIDAAREAIVLACCPLWLDTTRLLIEGVECPIRGEADPLMVLCNREHAILALARVLENAYEAVRDLPEPRVDVEISRQGDGMCRVRVSDNGAGIAPEQRREVWRSFHSESKGARMGLGLSIAKQLVDKHQGQIECVDGELGGACIQILLPQAGEDAASAL